MARQSDARDSVTESEPSGVCLPLSDGGSDEAWGPGRRGKMLDDSNVADGKGASGGARERLG